MTQPQRNAPGLLTASLRVFEISLGEMLWSRRTIFMGLVVGLPVLMALIVRLFNLAGASGIRVNNLAVDGPAIFGLMIWAFFMKFSVPVLGVFYGTSLVADEVEDKTITYLFTRPIAREAVLIGKYLAYLACTIFVVLPAIVLVWILVIPMGGSLGANFLDLVKDLAIVAVGLAVYGAVFAFIGAYFKRPLLIGLVFIFGWEQTIVAFPGSFKLFSGPGPARHAERLVCQHDAGPVPRDADPDVLAGLAGHHPGGIPWDGRPGRGPAGVRARTVIFVGRTDPGIGTFWAGIPV
jgi:ABC-type transport system involved in multi-copper enzyme maturation permease subunit